jgi:hypothetical protein
MVKKIWAKDSSKKKKKKKIWAKDHQLIIFQQIETVVFEQLQSYGVYFLVIWDSVGASWESVGFIIRVVELVWETYVKCVEFGPIVFDVDNMEGMQ